MFQNVLWINENVEHTSSDSNLSTQTVFRDKTCENKANKPASHAVNHHNLKKNTLTHTAHQFKDLHICSID